MENYLTDSDSALMGTLLRCKSYTFCYSEYYLVAWHVVPTSVLPCREQRLGILCPFYFTLSLGFTQCSPDSYFRKPVYLKENMKHSSYRTRLDLTSNTENISTILKFYYAVLHSCFIVTVLMVYVRSSLFQVADSRQGVLHFGGWSRR
jgi:hypothetical protein